MEVKIPTKPINPQALNDELAAALGPVYDGWRTEGENDIYLIFRADITPAQAQIAKDIFQAHNPALLTAEQELEIKREQAATAIKAARFKQVKTAIEDATSLAQLKPILLAMLELQYYTALAVRLSDEDINS